MCAEWSPEHTVTPEIAARVIAEQFPDLAGLPVTAFGAGWDNAVLAVGDEWLFRFVHRTIALDGSRRELAVLGALGDPFTLPIPRPVLVGTPSAAMPWPFWGTRHLAGVGLAESGLPDDARVGVATQVGAFLRELHDPDVAHRVHAAVDLPLDPIHRSDAARQASRARERLARLRSAGVWHGDDAVDELLERAGTLGPAPGPAVVVHGDLHVRHVLVAGGRATGVIDWGDVALADPCVDLMIGYAAFSGAARHAFLGEYPPVPPDRETRARTVAVAVSAALAEQAATDADSPLLTEALAAIGRAAR